MRFKVITILVILIVVICSCRKAANNRTIRNQVEKTETIESNSHDNDNNLNVEEYVIESCDYLNKIRKNPSAYSSTLKVDLSSVLPRHPLKLNQFLINAAQAKAASMASQNYFSHVDPEGKGMNIRIKAAGYEIPAEWYDEPSKNYFESLGAGVSSSKEIIDLLIIDEGTPSLGHRKHLLGIDDFHSNCMDFGIGYAYNPSSQYKHYWCVLIAKHNY